MTSTTFWSLDVTKDRTITLCEACALAATNKAVILTEFGVAFESMNEASVVMNALLATAGQEETGIYTADSGPCMDCAEVAA